MKIALVLSTAFVTTLPEAPDRERRIEQYVHGFGQIASMSARFPVYDVYSVDNTVADPARLDARLTAAIDAIPGLKGKSYFFDNNAGRINKGSGLVVQWAHILPELAGKYEYTVHYEPRQRLIDESFFARMAAQPAAYVCFYRDLVRFYIVPLRPLFCWTGLFSMTTADLEAYVRSPDRGVPMRLPSSDWYRYYRYFRRRVLPDWFAELRECIEWDLPRFLRKHEIRVVDVQDLGSLWHEEATDRWVPMKTGLFKE